MCSTALAASFRGDAAIVRRAWRVLLSGCAAGLAGAILFACAHSALIVPIWSRLANGLPLAAIAGIGLAASFEMLVPARTQGGIADGARFGALMFASLVPATLFSNILRLAGVAANDWPGAAAALAIAALSGAAAGRWWWADPERGAPDTSMRRGVAGAIGAVTLLVGTAGPVPVVNAARAAWLFAALMPIAVAAGAALAAARRLFDTGETR